MTQTLHKTITMPCHPKFLTEVRAVLHEMLTAVETAPRDKEWIILAVDEALSSIITYARYKNTANEVTVTLDIDDVRFKATILDSMNVFDGNGGLSDPAILAKERSFTMGIFIMRQVMDEVLYTFRKGFENQLELIKFV